jgi:hypothetical protein
LFVFIVGISFFCVGFKVFPKKRVWQIDNTTTAKQKVFVSIEGTIKTISNNLPDTDPIYSNGVALTEQQLLNSVMNDYNNIQNSFIILAANTDSNYANYKTDHEITITEGTASGLSGGEANPIVTGQFITSCKITLVPEAYKDAKRYLQIVSHEIGHCIGLDHPQETTEAVMSYFNGESVYRLAIDDKMGVVFLYPTDPGYADEAATLGLSCARR